jgi:hypothetical protein
MSGIDKMLKYLKGESRSLAGYRRRMERSPVHGWVSKRAKMEVVASLSHQEMVLWYAIQKAEEIKKEEKPK